jgi:hypothetical protein
MYEINLIINLDVLKLSKVKISYNPS